MVSRSRRVRDVPAAEQRTAVTDHPFLRTLSHWLQSLSVEAEIAYHRGALARLRQQQREKLAFQITEAFPPGAAFSSETIWQQPALRAACLDAEITTVQQLGVWLSSWDGLERIERNNRGVVWSVSADDLHHDAGIDDDDGV